MFVILDVRVISAAVEKELQERKQLEKAMCQNRVEIEKLSLLINTQQGRFYHQYTGNTLAIH